MVRRSRCTRETDMDGEVLSNGRFDVYRSITENIIAAVEAGPGVFRMPWHWMNANGGRPVNAFTGRPYRGVNVVMLWAETRMRGFDSCHWATYRQWRELGGQVRQGQRGSTIVFYKEIEVETASGQEGRDDKSPSTRLVARASRVFNSGQVDGWQAPDANRRSRVETLDHAETFVRATGADIREHGNHAFYNPGADYIQMPPRDSFLGTPTSSPTETFYSTLCHELTHWSGHKSRLNRDLSSRFGDRAYAAEELVAELGAAFLSADLGITNVPRLDHAQYIASWFLLMRDDERAIFTAASKAAAAADFLAAFSTARQNVEAAASP
jgi:antirestriction protein ArdC